MEEGPGMAPQAVDKAGAMKEEPDVAPQAEHKGVGMKEGTGMATEAAHKAVAMKEEPGMAPQAVHKAVAMKEEPGMVPQAVHKAVAMKEEPGMPPQEVHRAVGMKEGPGTATQTQAVHKAGAMKEEHGIAPQAVHTAVGMNEEPGMAPQAEHTAMGMNEGPGMAPQAIHRAVGMKEGPGMAPQAVHKAVAMKEGPGTAPQAVNKAAAIKKGPGIAPQPVHKAVVMKKGPGIALQPVHKAVAMKKGPGIAPQPVHKAVGMKKGPATTPQPAQKAVARNNGPGMAPQPVHIHSRTQQPVNKQNNPALYRQQKKRRRKHIILSFVGIVSCVLFAGSGVLIAIGYLNPGSIGLGLLGAGAVLFFATTIFLACCCICMDKKYPGHRPQLTIPRGRRRPGDTAISVINPPAGGRRQIPPYYPTAVHNGPVGPNHRKDPQTQDPTPSAPHTEDPATIAPTTSDGMSSSDHTPEQQRKEVNPEIPQSSDITPAEHPPIDVRIVSHPKKQESPQEKRVAEASCEDPPIDVRFVSNPKKDQGQQDSTSAVAVSEFMNILHITDPSIDTKTLPVPNQDMDYREMNETALGSTAITATSPAKAISVDVKIVCNAKKAQAEQTSMSAEGENIIAAADQRNKIKSASHHKKDLGQKKHVPVIQGTEAISKSFSVLSIDVCSVSNHEQNPNCEGTTYTAPGSEDLIALGYDPENHILSHRRQEKYKDDPPASAVSIDLINLHVGDSTTNVKPVTQFRKEQQAQDKTAPTPGSRETIAAGSEPNTKLRIPAHKRQEKHGEETPTTAQPQDLLSIANADTTTKIKHGPHPRKTQNHQAKNATASGGVDHLSAHAYVLPLNVKQVSHPKQDQSQQGTVPSAPATQAFPDAQAFASSTNENSDHKQQRHQKGHLGKPSRSADANSSSTDAPSHVRLESPPKKHPRDLNNSVQAPVSGDFSGTPAGDSSSTDKPMSHHKQEPHQDAPTAAHSADTVSTTGHRTRWKFVLPHQLDERQKDPKPLVRQALAPSQEETASHQNEGFS